ncbi:unnamed protein product [Diamesa tonsa]
MFQVKQSDQAFSVPEKEVEEQLLSQTYKSPDGRSFNVFTRGPRKDSVFPYNCLLCKVYSLRGEEFVQMHARGRKHQNKLVSNFLTATSTTKQVINRQKSSNNQDSDLDSLSSTSSRNSDKRKMKKNSVASQSRESEVTAQEIRKYLTPNELSQQSEKISHENYIHEKFRYSLKLAVDAINKKYKEYQESPEKHPLYSEEWTTFWNFRYKQLKKSGIDPLNYDFKPDWVKFWMQKVIILKEAEITKKKVEVRKKLNLPPNFEPKPEEVKEISVPKQSTSKSYESNRPAKPVKPTPIEVIDSTSSDSEDSYRRRSSNRPQRRHSRDSRDSRNSKESRDRKKGYQKRRHPEEPSSSSHKRTYRESDREFFEYRAEDSYRPQKNTIENESDESEVTVVSVCRLLTALESELGTLGSIVLDLLSQALSLEKLKPNSSDEILLTTENCVVFETIKEKFKGLLILDVLPVNKVHAVKKSVQYIAKLMHQAKLLDSKKNKNSATEILLLGEREAMALEVTKALVSQGKTDISTEELEALIDMYVEAKKSQAEEESAEVEEAQVEEVKVQPIPEVSKVTVAATTSDSSNDKEKNQLELLTDNDLKTLLRNFGDLSTEEQNHLISFLQKIEKQNPSRVEKLRKYVNMGEDDVDCDSEPEQEEVSPPPSAIPTIENNRPIFNLDDEDDFDDYQLVNKTLHNVQQSSKRPAYKLSFTDTDDLTDNLLGSLNSALRQY